MANKSIPIGHNRNLSSKIYYLPGQKKYNRGYHTNQNSIAYDSSSNFFENIKNIDEPSSVDMISTPQKQNYEDIWNMLIQNEKKSELDLVKSKSQYAFTN